MATIEMASSSQLSARDLESRLLLGIPTLFTISGIRISHLCRRSWRIEYEVYPISARWITLKLDTIYGVHVPRILSYLTGNYNTFLTGSLFRYIWWVIRICRYIKISTRYQITSHRTEVLRTTTPTTWFSDTDTIAPWCTVPCIREWKFQLMAYKSNAIHHKSNRSMFAAHDKELVISNLVTTAKLAITSSIMTRFRP